MEYLKALYESMYRGMGTGDFFESNIRSFVIHITRKDGDFFGNSEKKLYGIKKGATSPLFL